jgi:hypothetical protein
MKKLAPDIWLNRIAWLGLGHRLEAKKQQQTHRNEPDKGVHKTHKANLVPAISNIGFDLQ